MWTADGLDTGQFLTGGEPQVDPIRTDIATHPSHVFPTSAPLILVKSIECLKLLEFPTVRVTYGRQYIGLYSKNEWDSELQFHLISFPHPTKVCSFSYRKHCTNLIHTIFRWRRSGKGRSFIVDLVWNYEWRARARGQQRK
jgi:hypothetical protein